MAAANDSITATNRRTGARIPLNAPVYFSDAAGFGALMHGRVVEQSSGGLTLQSHTPVAPGTQLDIELQASTGDTAPTVTIIKGRAKHLKGDAENGYRIGIALEYKKPNPPSAKKKSTSPPANVDIPATQPESEPIHVSTVPRETKPDTFIHAKATVLVILLLIAAAVFFLNRADETRFDSAVTGDGNFYQLEGDDAPDTESLATVTGPRRSTLPVSGTPGDFESNDTLRQTDLPTTIPKRPTEEERLARFIEPSSDQEILAEPTTPESNPLSDALDLARRAMQAESSGNATAARALSAQAQRAAVDLPQPWAEVLQHFRDSIIGAEFGTDPRRTPFPTFNNWVGLGPQLTDVPVDAPVVVYVDTVNFTLTVVRDANPVLQFPVGLGVNGSTPRGVFAIGNKIIEPTWYNSGNPIAPDDPENPLGDHWMGLSSGDNPLVYGIHPTDIPASIGDTLSRGCIRMRPADARTLYAMLPLGAPVVIGPGATAPKL